jgi:TonB-linked SusC/RagA family outer membrane protein
MKQQKRIKKGFKSLSLLALLLFCFTNIAHAQKNTITGTVIDETGTPIPGVTILVVGTEQAKKNVKGTTTDFDGNYTIKAGRKKSLVFSYIGYKKQIVIVGLQKTINITLIADVNQLDEVVVVGYGTQNRRDVTGSITKLTTEAIERTNNATVEQALTGRIAGVNTISSDGSPGAGIRIRIRGGTSINANNEPLYVIDGLPIEVDYSISDGPGELVGPSSSPLANLDPNSIASIDVLKDASAAAIYGARGANGVVIITTKSGKSGKTQITFDSSLTTNTVPESRYVDLLTTSQYGELVIDRFRYANGIEDPSAVFGDDDLTAEQEQARYDALPNTNWQKELYRTGVISKYALQARGGNSKNTYAIGGTYFKNEGAIVNSYFKRYNFNVNLQNKLTDKLKIKTVLLPSYSTKKGPISGGDFNQSKLGIVIRALTRRTDRGIGVLEDDVDGEIGVWVDPVTEAKNAQNYTNIFGFKGNTLISYKLSKELTASVRLGANIKDGKTKSYYTKEYGRGYISNGIGTRYHYQSLSYNNQNMLNYRTSFGKENEHRVNVLAAFEQSFNSRETEYLTVKDFPVETLGFNALQNGLLPSIPQTFTTEKMLKSYLARVNYSFSDLYNLTVSMRADGSSRFGLNNKWGYFPAVGFSWNAHNEKFLENKEAISNLKLRLSYGQTGNQGIPAYGSFAILGVSNTVFNDQVHAGLAVTSLPNPDLKWEFTDQYDIGIDAGFFDNRLNFTMDVYYKHTEDLLLQVPLPLTTGFGSRLSNIGNVENKGLEIALNTVNLDKAFKWTTDFTFSVNKNKVLGLGGSLEKTFTDQFSQGALTGLIRVGESLGNWIGYQTNGVFTYEDFDASGNVIDSSYGTPTSVNTNGKPKLGDLKYIDQLTVDSDGDGIADATDGIINTDDQTIIARTQPKHFGSMYNNFSYKGFELGLLFTYKYGFDVINGNKHRMVATGYGKFNKTADLADHWTPLNTDTNVPRADYQDKNFTDRFVEDGSFIRLQSVNLSYNLPSKTAAKAGFKSLKIYSNIDNLFIWTKYSGYDPEVSIARGQKAITSQNLDYGAYPRTLNVTLGIKVGF